MTDVKPPNEAPDCFCGHSFHGHLQCWNDNCDCGDQRTEANIDDLRAELAAATHLNTELTREIFGVKESLRVVERLRDRPQSERDAAELQNEHERRTTEALRVEVGELRRDIQTAKSETAIWLHERDDVKAELAGAHSRVAELEVELAAWLKLMSDEELARLHPILAEHIEKGKTNG
jgi:chromosome segregation ATPase